MVPPRPANELKSVETSFKCFKPNCTLCIYIYVCTHTHYDPFPTCRTVDPCSVLTQTQWCFDALLHRHLQLRVSSCGPLAPADLTAFRREWQMRRCSAHIIYIYLIIYIYTYNIAYAYIYIHICIVIVCICETISTYIILNNKIHYTSICKDLVWIGTGSLCHGDPSMPPWGHPSNTSAASGYWFNELENRLQYLIFLMVYHFFLSTTSFF